MSDYQERRPPAGRGGPGGGGPGGGAAAGPVHQVVFRWDGNQGRQDTGMKAVAHSCSAGRAEQLGRELGPLLWVSGAAAERQSVVRTLSRDGEVMLLQRWPTTDRGGRPSTVSHVLVGDPRALKTRQCLGLSHGGWGNRESAERAAGRLRPVECGQLDAVARRRLPGMQELLPTVQHALILVTAEWLRDPAQRVSLLTDEEKLPGWPGREAAPLVYLGLFLLFGSWLGQEWTYATYDTADTHQLRLMCVPRWEPDAGGSGPLARITGHPPADLRFEHRAAARLVSHLLAHPADGPGVPQLVDALKDGAALGWPQRRSLLKEILDAVPRTVPRTAAAPHRLPSPELASPEFPSRELPSQEFPSPELASPEFPSPELASPEFPSPGLPSRGLPSPEDEPARSPVSRPVAPQPEPAPAPVPPTPTLTPVSPPPALTPEPPPEPAPTPAPPTPLPVPTPAPRPATLGTGPAAAPEASALHEDLRAPQRRNAQQRGLLRERLRTHSDGLLLDELRSTDLPADSLDLLLHELGDADRVRVRETKMRHELCAEVLGQGLYFEPNGQGAQTLSRTAMASRAADLFTWAVAPLARDERYRHDLQELLHRMCLDRHPTAGNWLWQSIITPVNGPAPDLPPALWQQILRDVIGQSVAPRTAPSTSHAVSPAAPVSTTSPEPSATVPEPPTVGARVSALATNPGCVVGTGVGVIAVLIAILLIFV
ncbi:MULTISPECIES: hypothetical protein [unclassified Streptomyces]|uniref:hypothetical protein n=1 Tax=unclassified Streptomyces TaxID=2593676 RepID=UPI000889EBF3|nr:MULTISPECIES: hypothetical protein [unclassified Streptomyces]PBC85757.1 hypothetical protein BX261_5781 [Streptomyces sp. 2321.6]SDR06789.1 hypothetical protein SAMN05216511_1481 [Streptomyces sp. KS_16]SED78187.1 hypothetical protein SAMN05428940_5807 [Streptomyces sp. 2133.1]SNC72635.1 hypothetical protein SAMN06272741_5707 [Streptomyces sp. 2114.4]